MVCDVDLSIADATWIHTVEVARGFAGEGLDVDLVARGPNPELDGVRYTQGRGADANRISRLVSLNLHVARLLWKRRRAARRLYVRHRWSLMPVLFAGRLLGYRVVTQVDDIPYGRGYEFEISPAIDWAQRLCTIVMARLAHGIVAVTAQIKGLLVNEFHARGERIAVLPNGVDIDFFHPLPRDEAIARVGLDPALRYLVFCGHLAPWVDYDALIGGFAAAARQVPDARLLLVGDGHQRERVERQSAELGVAPLVTITGFIRDRARVRDYLSAATVAIASHQSAYIDRIGVSPTKVAEYLAVGRAVVVKDVPGLREVVQEGGVGLVVRDAETMGQALVELLEPGRADELGARGRALAEERFAWPSIVHRTVPLFGL
jgi:glycosyltransferase involved in cell wall biosynthesis